MFLYFGNEVFFFFKYFLRVFWIFFRRLDKRFSCFWILAMLITFMIKGDRVIFFIRVKNLVFILNLNKILLI